MQPFRHPLTLEVRVHAERGLQCAAVSVFDIEHFWTPARGSKVLAQQCPIISQDYLEFRIRV